MSRKIIMRYLFISLLISTGCKTPQQKAEHVSQRIDSSVFISALNNDHILLKKSDYTLIQCDTVGIVKNSMTQRIDTVLANECQTGPDTTEKFEQPEDFFFHSEYHPKSLIGPYLSYEYVYNGSGGAHPIYGSNYRTIDVRTKTAISLDSLFNADSIYEALMTDSTIIHSISKDKNPTDLYELVSALDGGCEISFFEFLNSFAITGIDSAKVDIEFGLEHGCEVMRGNFTTLNIKLPISSVQNEFIHK